jgi:myo-inositol 2-dehydrogenase / D-chiro-inositol 1-dehydrogenase
MATSDGNKRTAKKVLTTSAATMALVGAAATRAYAAGSGKIKVGLLGCGGRGNGAIKQNLSADSGIEVIAVADLFGDKAKKTADSLNKDGKFKGRVNIKPDHVFSGYDCHLKLAQCDADLLCMATAPAFRGRQILAAVKAGKHVFTEKPVGTDVAGIREVIEASEIAAEKGLGIVAGTQRRHEFGRIELMKRIHNGAIGELSGGQCYWYGRGIWYRKPSDGMSEMDWQCHNWYHFNWLSGDQICEQHIHNIDILNWCFNGPPKKITAVGGRGCRDYSKDAKEVCKKYNNGSDKNWAKYNGDIYDHIYAEFEYANGARVQSFSGHGPGSGRNGEKVVGTKGTSDCRSRISGENEWKYQGKNVNGQQQEHNDLIASIRAGKPLNEGRRIAESCLTAIGARISAYTGRTIDFDWLLNESKHRLVPPESAMKAGPGHFNPIATGHDELI